MPKENNQPKIIHYHIQATTVNIVDQGIGSNQGDSARLFFNENSEEDKLKKQIISLEQEIADLQAIIRKSPAENREKKKSEKVSNQNQNFTLSDVNLQIPSPDLALKSSSTWDFPIPISMLYNVLDAQHPKQAGNKKNLKIKALTFLGEIFNISSKPLKSLQNNIKNRGDYYLFYLKQIKKNQKACIHYHVYMYT